MHDKAVAIKTRATENNDLSCLCNGGDQYQSTCALLEVVVPRPFLINMAGTYAFCWFVT